MGLDAVEIVLRAEELYSISITDEEAGSMHTVGEFYNVICAKLSVKPLPAPVTPAELPEITKREKSFWFMQPIRRSQRHLTCCPGRRKVYGTA